MNLRPVLSIVPFVCLLITSCQRGSADQEQASNIHQEPEPASGPPLNPQFSTALAKVDAKCPQEYPEIVTPLPDAKNFNNIGNGELMSMLESWNPALRSQAAKALSLRGTDAMGVFRQGTNSNNWMVRAGSATALGIIIQKEVQAAARADQQAIQDKHADVISRLVPPGR